MSSPRWTLVLILLVVPWSRASAIQTLRNRFALDKINRQIHGRVLDFTATHGTDNRLYSPALGKKRDLYVYLPPGFNPACRYPLVLWLHGFAQDEGSFLVTVVPLLDRAIVEGRLPPAIIAAPDGSISGKACINSAGSFYLNSKAGAFEDYLMGDVWNFLHANFPIRPEREAHVIAGVSMGGGAAFNKAFKYQDRVGVVIGIFPPLNIRWLSCRNRYMDNFDPCCWKYRENFRRPFEVVGRFYGVFTVRLGSIVRPLYGRDADVVAKVATDNPIEMLDAYQVAQSGQAMYIAYAGRDEFNIDAQVESFLHVAREKGVAVEVAYQADGRHDLKTAVRFLPGILDWLKPRLAPYAPTP